MRLVTNLIGVAIAVLVVTAALVTAPASPASERHPSMTELEREVMCPTCGTTLNHSNSPAADRMRVYLRGRIDAGWTRQQILDGVVAEYGGDESVLARTPTHGRGAAAWALPMVMVLVALLGGAVTLRRWRRAGAAPVTQASSVSSSSASSSSSLTP
jgi:cytochrome c-type biogenesis protein CcmH